MRETLREQKSKEKQRKEQKSKFETSRAKELEARGASPCRVLAVVTSTVAGALVYAARGRAEPHDDSADMRRGHEKRLLNKEREGAQ